MVNVIGAGLAGLSAAITLAKRGIPANLISAQTSERAQSVLAEGGINAALNVMGENDSVGEHVEETIKGGVYLADEEAVRGLCEAAPGIVLELKDLGVPFQTENGRLVQRFFGGQKKRRAAYAKSSTGKALMTALIDESRRFEEAGLIQRFPHHELLDLEVVNGKCLGAEVIDLWSSEVSCFAGPVLLAVGGLNGFFEEMTTGTRTNSGNAQAIAFACGAVFGNLEMIQFHPTTAGIAGKRMLISEAARAEGGRLYIERDGSPWYFMEEKYPELKNLMPRDVVTRESTQVLARTDTGDQVYLDMTGVAPEIWERKLSDMREEIIHYLGIDPAKEPVSVKPGIHFFMGGLLVDRGHRTSILGLYAAGECACQYHGANRLGGNSLLGAIYGGKKSAETLSEEFGNYGGEIAEKVLKSEENKKDDPSPAFMASLREILRDGMGIVRSGEEIDRCIMRLEELLAGKERNECEKRRVDLAKAMLLSARERRESRGAHFRSDFPERDDDSFKMTTAAGLKEGKVIVDFVPIGADHAY